ncbi:MAG: orotate phosphoribosyltransferase [candidate division FCPU426 bacterium]
MTPAQVQTLFEESGALLSGHFQLTSGNHSNRYLQCALVTQHPGHAASLADALAGRFKDQDVDVVLGPAVGGIVLAQEVAQALYRQGRRQVRAIFCERVDGRMALRRGFSLSSGERVLAVEDVVTTGGSVQEAVALAQAAGCTVVGVGCLVDRSSAPPQLGAPLVSLLKVNADLFPPDNCPLCRQGLPAIKPGSRGLK